MMRERDINTALLLVLLAAATTTTIRFAGIENIWWTHIHIWVGRERERESARRGNEGVYVCELDRLWSGFRANRSGLQPGHGLGFSQSTTVTSTKTDRLFKTFCVKPLHHPHSIRPQPMIQIPLSVFAEKYTSYESSICASIVSYISIVKTLYL